MHFLQRTGSKALALAAVWQGDGTGVLQESLSEAVSLLRCKPSLGAAPTPSTPEPCFGKFLSHPSEPISKAVARRRMLVVQGKQHCQSKRSNNQSQSKKSENQNQSKRLKNKSSQTGQKIKVSPTCQKMQSSGSKDERTEHSRCCLSSYSFAYALFGYLDLSAVEIRLAPAGGRLASLRSLTREIVGPRQSQMCLVCPPQP